MTKENRWLPSNWGTDTKLLHLSIGGCDW